MSAEMGLTEELAHWERPHAIAEDVMRSDWLAARDARIKAEAHAAGRAEGGLERAAAVDALAKWLRSQVMGTTFCAHHPWERGDQDYWRQRVASIPLAAHAAESTEADVEAAARALYLEDMNASDGFDDWLPWDHDDNVGRLSYRENARAALDAARIAREADTSGGAR